MFVYLAIVWCALVVNAFSQSSSNDVLLRRFHYMNMPVARYVAENDELQESLGGIDNALRRKRFEDLQDYLEDPSAKRTSLKRLAILSARGFGRK